MSKVAIIGAGFVGSSAAFALSIMQNVNELVLIDVFKEKAEGEAIDLSHGLPFLGQMKIWCGDYPDVKDCDVIVVTAGANRKPGETRIDLAKKNVAIAKGVTENIMKYYNKGVILVVANPIDILTYKIQKWSGLPANKVIGTGTTLDSARFRQVISSRFDVDVSNVHGYIVGEHGDTQLPAWSTTHIAGINIADYSAMLGKPLTAEEKASIMEEVKTSGAEIIKKKGATYYGIGITIATIVGSLLKNQNTVRTISSVMDGKYGISDVALSVPCIINADGLKSVLDVKFTDDELAGLKKSGDALKAILEEVKDI